MSEFFLELFTEEMPPSLQNNTKVEFLEILKNFLDEKKISYNKLYYSIGDVSNMTDLKQYVLRYWETEFKILNPEKNRAGNRRYKKEDIQIIRHIKELLYEKKFSGSLYVQWPVHSMDEIPSSFNRFKLKLGKLK